MLLVAPAKACRLTARQPTAATPPASSTPSAAHAAPMERGHCRRAGLWAARRHCHGQPCCQARGTCTAGYPACRMPPLSCQGAGSCFQHCRRWDFSLPAGAGDSSCRRPPGPPAACQNWPSIASCPSGGRLTGSRPSCACGRSAGSSSYFLPLSASPGPWARSEEAALGALRAGRRVAVLPVGGAVGVAVQLRVCRHRSRGRPKAQRVQPRRLWGREAAGEVQLLSGGVRFRCWQSVLGCRLRHTWARHPRAASNLLPQSTLPVQG
jgi:hypothetical protein